MIHFHEFAIIIIQTRFTKFVIFIKLESGAHVTLNFVLHERPTQVELCN